MQKQFTEALQNINKAIDLDSNYTQAYHLAGDIYMLSGLSKVQAAQAQDPSNGTTNGYTDFFKNAIWAYERYLKSGGQETVDVDYRLGQAYYYIGAYDVAIETLTKAIAMGTDKSVAYDFKAKALFRLKRFDEAIGAYRAYEEKITKGDPNFVWGKEHFEFFRDRAMTYDQLYYDSKKEGTTDTTFLVEAIPYFVKAIELNDKELFLWNRLALAHYNLGHYTEAIPWLEKRIAQDSTHLSSYQYLAFCYLKMTDYPKATGYLEKMYELNPKSEFVVKTLATTYLFQLKEREKGRKYMVSWAEIAPNSFEPFKWLGYIAISEKPAKKEQAIDNLTKAFKLIEANGVDKCKEIDVIIWLAQANSFYDDNPHAEEAMKWVKRGLQCDPNNETLKALRDNLE
jgi:tetratricopeptide (TPR) repeat protein